MKKVLYSAVISLSLIFLAGISFETNAQTISGSIGTIKRGGAAKATIVMDIPGGLHVNSNNPGSKYSIPTSVKAGADGAKIGSVMYPRGKNRKLAFSEDTINVYENRAVFTFNVAVPAKFRGSVIKIPVTVRYQACTDEVCYPPKNKEITLTARIR